MGDQFLRNRLMFSVKELEQLKKSRIAVFGVGAVGGYVIEALTRVGVCNFILVDFDSVSETNINRQLLALHSTVGEKKCELAKNRILDINPKASVEIFSIFFGKENSVSILDGEIDIVIDAIDSVRAKSVLISECYKRNLKIFSSMGAALRRDWRHIKVEKIFNVKGCSLARHLKKLLKKLDVPKGVDVQCVYSDEPIDKTRIGNWQKIDIGDGRDLNRRELGSISTITGIFGLILANEVINYIVKNTSPTGIEPVLQE